VPWQRLRAYLLAICALAALVAASEETQSQGAWTQADVLTCKLNPSIGFIIVGHQSMECRFQPAGPNPPQAYEGAINTVGLDLGVTAGGVLAWTVLAPTIGLAAGALAGEYVGASGDIGIGVGAGANVLLGGSARTVAPAASFAGRLDCAQYRAWRVNAQIARCLGLLAHFIPAG
jgi:Protein of unknown function (DUF992)